MRDSEDVTESGRLFQARAAATEKVRAPIVDRAETGTMSTVTPNGAVAVIRRLPPGEGHQRDIVVRVRSGIGMKAQLAET